MSSAPSPANTELDDFLDYLLRNGFPCGVGERVRAFRVIQKFGGEKPGSNWRALLGPIFARTPSEQDRFRQAFELYFAAARPAEAPPPPQGEVRLELPRRATRIIHWRALGMWTGIAVAVAALFIAGTPARVGRQLHDWTQDPGPPVRPSPPAPPDLADSRAVDFDEALIPNTRLERGTRGCAEWECVSVAWRPVAIAGPWLLLLAAAIAVSTPQWKRRALAKRVARRGPPVTWPVTTRSDALRSYKAALSAAAQALNRRLTAEFTDLNIPATIRATVRAGGFPTVRFKNAQLLPEYLVLLEQRSPRDHFAAWWMTVIGELRGMGVRLDVFYYGRDGHRVRAASGSATASIDRVLDLYPGHAVFIIGDPSVVVNWFSGELASWAGILKTRDCRAILTPQASFEWGPAEAFVQRHLTIVPARIRHLPAVARFFDHSEGQFGEQAFSEADETSGFPIEETAKDGSAPDAASLFALRMYLDPLIFEWLCACAVYPELQWDLTLETGRIIDPSGRVFAESKLLELIRLEWFRTGGIPASWRGPLIASLPPEKLRKVRELIVASIGRNPAPENTFAREWQDLQIAAQLYWLNPHDRNRRAELEVAMAAAAETDVRRDPLLAQLRRDWTGQAATERFSTAPRRGWLGLIRGGWRYVAVTAALCAAGVYVSVQAPVSYTRTVQSPRYGVRARHVYSKDEVLALVTADVAKAVEYFAKHGFKLQIPVEIRDVNDPQVEFAYENAFFDGNGLVFGLGLVNSPHFGPYEPGVVYHEVSHAVVDRTSRLEFAGQPGAINDSFCDVLGVVIRGSGWSIGATRGPSGVLRSLDDPTRSGQPDHMSKYKVLPNTAAGGYGGVFTNSGIINKAAFLISEGGTHYGVTVPKGIGRQRLGDLYMMAVTQQLTRTSQFEDLRRGLMVSARTLYRSDPTSTRDAADTISLAFKAVGIGPQ